MDVRYINPFIVAASEAFDVMLKMPCIVAPPQVILPDYPFAALYEVSAIIDLHGPASGVVVLNFGRNVALAVASALACEEITSIDQDCVDALGELANLVGGGAKGNLPDASSMRLGTPRVLLAAKFVRPNATPAIGFHCDTPHGRFLIELGLRTPVQPKALAA